jgi:signal transduction histidine kinase/CheY-like chemotaxis protein
MQADEEEKLLRTVALQNVQSILQARQRAEQELVKAKDALEEETRVLELLNTTGATLASSLDLQSLLQTATDAGTRLSGAQFGAFVYRVSPLEGDPYSLYAVCGPPPEVLEGFGAPRGEGVVRLGDVRKDPRFDPTAPLHATPLAHLPIRSYLAVPVTSRSHAVLGTLLFGHRDCDVFTERSERMIVGLAAQAAVALDNARLYEDARRSAEDRARLLEAERAARSEVERVSLLKDEFLATLSHELRTPLNAVLGWSKILLSRIPGDSEIRRGVETIARNAHAQSQLIEDLLDMNAIVSGKIRLDVQRIELAPVVVAAVDAVRPSAEAKGLVLRTTIDPNTAPVLGDPNRLQQVVWNLLTNAVKFTPKGGKIDVIVQRVNSHAEITVQDHGIGVTPEFLPHLFERFRQADSSTTRTYGGLGLGLSIVKQLVELHGGVIHAESEGPGKGATFVVSLPLRAVRVGGPATGEHPTSGRGGVGAGLAVGAFEVSLAGIVALVVDDGADARELVKAVLVGAGATVLLAASAEEGLALAKAHRPDVIVSDIGMPGRDGYQFIRDVRGLGVAEGGRVPAIALTAFARSEDRTRAMLAGYQVHMAKPIEPHELLATIKSLTNNIR